MKDALPFPFPLRPEDVHKRRARILAALCAEDAGFADMPVSSLDRGTPQAMLRLYDALFTGGFLGRAYRELRVTLSSRLLSSAGKFVYAAGERHVDRAEIRMSSDFLFRLSGGPYLLNGLSVATPQEAFLVVFEHELCHALEMALYGSTGHSQRFLTLANGLFGHTATRHSLPTRKEDAAQNGVRPGARVSFAYDGRTLHGVVSYVGKTASVMVRDARGDYRDASGRRYVKYRVPLNLLNRD